MHTIHVSKSAQNGYTSVQEAILAVEDGHEEPVRIHLEPGIYEEKIFVRKENIEITGDDPEHTILRYGDGAGKQRPDGQGEYGTFNTAVLLLAGKNITVRNITIENTAGPGRKAGQALALYAAADRLSFYNCRFLGYQDTIFAGNIAGFWLNDNPLFPDFFTQSAVPIAHKQIRNYFKDCYIAGDVDFIFGPNVAFFDNCEIYSRGRSYITAASTPADQEYGFVFWNCALTGLDNMEEGLTYLGRPWRDYAKTAFISCTMGSHICPEGWNNWGKAKAEAVCAYVEYGNKGPGAYQGMTEVRAPFSRQLNNPELLNYFSKEQVLGGEDGWNP
ncbi:MAG: pectinesterase family protein [Clostridiales bacterium]|nr:pectinesterase family protein [Clostridiales bacterium]